MKTRTVLLLVCVLTLHNDEAKARRRNITEITYRFTNCESVNHDGPRVNSRCIPLYEKMGSPLGNPGMVFRFEDGTYDGAQGFRVPTDSLYNITVAGARGGEGVCNYHYGLGGVFRAQVRLTTDYEYLILVGHKGTSVCDVPRNADHPICQLPRPTNLTEAQACNDSWFNWTAANVSESTQSNRYTFNGGGGGGGASMIWPRRVSDKQFTDLPLIISPGGGGASAVLDYEYVADLIRIKIPGLHTSTGNEMIYTFHVNGHMDQYSSSWTEGARGFRLSVQNGRITSGAGSGWNPSFDLPLLDIDGKLLSQATDFAEGGFDCSSALQDSSVNGFVFTNVFGGYGGGGGGCGSGGGGGGYTGGHVIFNDNRSPGSGGDSGVFNLTAFPHKPGVFYLNQGDGFVELMPSNCDCDGECVVYNEENQFECLCSNDTILAENERSCYREINITVSQTQQLNFSDSGETFYVHGLRFDDTSFLLYGINLSLSVSPKAGNEMSSLNIACAVVFVGQDSQSVLASNPVRVNEGRAYQLTSLGEMIDGVFGPTSDFVSFLDFSTLVTGAFLLSNGECSLVSPFRVKINSEDDTDPVENFLVDNLFGDADTADSARRILRESPPTIMTTSPPEPTESFVNVGLVIGLVIVGLVLLVTVVGIIALILYIRFMSRKRAHIDLRPGTESRSYLVDQELPHLAPYEIIKDSKGAIEIDKVTGNEYATIDVGGATPNPYSTLTANGETFTPRYGIVAPAVDFTMYNRERANSAIDNWDYPRNNLVYTRELGEGQFGKVLLMKAKDIAGYSGKIPVAVKTLTSRDPEVIQKFMEEAELMKKFSHPNIVSLLGISIADSDGEVDEESAPLMILEYMPYGDLQSFLSSHKPNEVGQTSISQHHFLQFSTDIAKALDFLSMNKYVHRDIAARNCLVGPDLHIKIADFGLSRGVYDKDYYKIAGKAVLPVRWLAPESLLFGVFSTASDVWSYGVTIWEITSYGDTPLEDFEVQEVVSAAQNGSLQHTRPVHCTDLLYDVMCQCHQREAKERPSFEDILSMLMEDRADTPSDYMVPITKPQH